MGRSDCADVVVHGRNGDRTTSTQARRRRARRRGRVALVLRALRRAVTGRRSAAPDRARLPFVRARAAARGTRGRGPDRSATRSWSSTPRCSCRRCPSRPRAFLGMTEEMAVNKPVAELLVPADAEAQGRTGFAAAIAQAADGQDPDTARSFVRPWNTFGVRMRARIATCGPPRAALVVLEDSAPRAAARRRGRARGPLARASALALSRSRRAASPGAPNASAPSGSRTEPSSLLAVLEQRDDRAPDRHRGAVERVRRGPACRPPAR